MSLFPKRPAHVLLRFEIRDQNTIAKQKGATQDPFGSVQGIELRPHGLNVRSAKLFWAQQSCQNIPLLWFPTSRSLSLQKRD